MTLHEHSALPQVQQAANMLFCGTADRLVFTTEYEARAFGATSQGQVIPIGSNIPTHPASLNETIRCCILARSAPGKGIEAFIDLAGVSDAAGEPTRFVVIGSAPPRWRDYRRVLRAEASGNVAWVEDAPGLKVAQAMATGMAAYLPFPDGAGLRRGSLIAALSDGLPVIAPLGPATTDDLRGVVLAADTPSAALAQIRALRGAPALGRRLGAAGRIVVRRFGWAAIAEQHATLYQAVLAMHALAGQLVLGFSATPNELGLAVLPGVMLSAIKLSYELRVDRRPRLLTVMCCVLTSAALALSLSRGALLWFAFGFAFVVGPTRYSRSFLLKLVLVGGLIALVVGYGLHAAASSLDAGSDTVEARVLLWKTSLDAMINDPYVALLGDGTAYVRTWSWQTVGWEFPDAHSGWIDQVLFFGIPALLLYLPISQRFFAITDTVVVHEQRIRVAEPSGLERKIYITRPEHSHCPAFAQAIQISILGLDRLVYGVPRVGQPRITCGNLSGRSW